MEHHSLCQDLTGKNFFHISTFSRLNSLIFLSLSTLFLLWPCCNNLQSHVLHALEAPELVPVFQVVSQESRAEQEILLPVPAAHSAGGADIQ